MRRIRCAVRDCPVEQVMPGDGDDTIWALCPAHFDSPRVVFRPEAMTLTAETTHTHDCHTREAFLMDLSQRIQAGLPVVMAKLYEAGFSKAQGTAIVDTAGYLVGVLAGMTVTELEDIVNAYSGQMELSEPDFSELQ